MACPDADPGAHISGSKMYPRRLSLVTGFELYATDGSPVVRAGRLNYRSYAADTLTSTVSLMIADCQRRIHPLESRRRHRDTGLHVLFESRGFDFECATRSPSIR
jgi:hypothetical protein